MQNSEDRTNSPFNIQTFDNSYTRLPDVFFERTKPTSVASPYLIKFNHKLGKSLSLKTDDLSPDQLAHLFSGNEIAAGSDPIAMAYAGHQFGGWVPRLGDGRAVLLGEVLDRDNIRQDIQLKGSGRTPFSRSGDGRAWIGPILREYIISEAMAAYDIPTTRALAAVTTGENVYREHVQPGGIITRVARSHIRVGTFQYFAARDDLANLKILADYVIDRLYPDLKTSEAPYLGLLEQMLSKQANLIAKWMGVGFIHGVMNTDNVLISGETIDYGPCAFMDAYDPKQVFSSIDHRGRYAYGNQPFIGLKNGAFFASCLLPLIHKDETKAMDLAEQAVEDFQAKYKSAWAAVIASKLGLETHLEGDEILGQQLLDLMEQYSADFTLTFRRLSNLTIEQPHLDSLFLNLFNSDPAAHEWLKAWRERLMHNEEGEQTRLMAMKSVNPAYIPRNHLIEDMIEHALDGNFTPFERLSNILETPFDEKTGQEIFQQPPHIINPNYRTFCGT